MEKQPKKPRTDEEDEKRPLVDPIIADQHATWQNRIGRIPSDVDGSYTGVPLDNERPIQDADDL